MPLMIKQPVTKKKLSDTVEEELEAMIRRGELNEGDALPSERELMKVFGVGRPSVRDALSALSRKGLVKISSGERTRVTRPTADNIISELSGLSKDFLTQSNGLIYFDQLRQFFESSLVRYAAERATDQQIDELGVALELNKKSVGNAELFKKTDVNFHRVIAAIPHNPIFVAVHQALVDWVVKERPSDADPDSFRRESYEGHKRIYDSIRNHDVEAADTALRHHIQYVFDNYYKADET